MGDYDYHDYGFDSDDPFEDSSGDESECEVNCELRDQRAAWDTLKNPQKVKKSETVWEAIISCRNALTSVWKGKTFVGDTIDDFPARITLILKAIQKLIKDEFIIGSYSHQIGYIVKYVLPKCDGTKKDTIQMEILMQETIDQIKGWNQKQKLANAMPKAQVLGQLSSLNISGPLISTKPAMTVGSVKYTQCVGESVSQVAGVGDVMDLKFGKFRRFKVPFLWVPESDDDEDGDEDDGDSLGALSQDGGAYE